MPELPDVEVFRKYVDKMALGQRIEEVEVFAKEVLANVSPEQIISKTKGNKFELTARHGKYLFVNLSDNGWIVFHFGMTGYLDYFMDDKSIPRHTRVLFRFDNGYNLAFILQRKLGRMALTENIDHFVRTQDLGLDALDNELDLEAFKKILKSARSNIKSALMKQERIAGIGNIYSDEILFQAKLNPTAQADQLNDKQMKLLFKETKEVLKTAIDAQADPKMMPENFLLAHRKKGGKCPVCSGEIATTKISGRTAYFCPKCQSD